MKTTQIKCLYCGCCGGDCVDELVGVYEEDKDLDIFAVFCKGCINRIGLEQLIDSEKIIRSFCKVIDKWEKSGFDNATQKETD